MLQPSSSAVTSGSRDKTIDVLRFIGLSMIILGHTRVPGVLQQFRCFDVPLMVVVSGLSFAKSTSKQGYLSYIWKRIKRLVFPVWIFLSFYFMADWLFQFAPSELNRATIISSYTFLYGIGYVWIIRVFLLVAITSPLIRYLCDRIESNKTYLLVLLLSWCGYEAFLYFTAQYTENQVWGVMSLFVYYAIAYSLIMSFGVKLRKLTSFEVWFICLLSLTAFVIAGCLLYVKAGKVVPTLRYKYPPSVYYVSYAMAAICFLWVISDKIVKAVEAIPGVEPVIMFMARNSIWVYLWHIIAVKLMSDKTSGFFAADYLIIYGTGAILTWCQVNILYRLVLPGIENPRLKENLKTVLTG
jgi:fucose 4-O-acetylase-like acetyltransferase